MTLRTIFNQGIAAGVTDQKHYPFGRGKILIKFPESLKIGLTADEVKRLEDIELPEGENHARNLLLFSFLLCRDAGLRRAAAEMVGLSERPAVLHDGEKPKRRIVKNPGEGRSDFGDPRDTPHGLVFPDLSSLTDLTKAYDVQLRIKTSGTACNIHLKAIAKKMRRKCLFRPNSLTDCQLTDCQWV